MNFPIIKRKKNEFSIIKKNFLDINRYKTIFNNTNFLSSQNSTIEPKLHLNNFHNVSDNQKFDEFNSTKRNNNIFKKNISIYNNNKYFSDIFNRKKYEYFNSLSPSHSHSKFNFTTFTKNINSSFNTIVHASSNINDFSSEKRILKSNRSNPNFEIKKKKEIKKIDKILTKFKLNKIISDNSHNGCYIQELKNNTFLDKFKNKLFSDKFIKYQIKKHRNFLFDKNENPIKKMNNYLINIDNSNNLNENFSSEEIFKSLNKHEIKLIKADVAYFKDVNENIIKDLMKFKSNTISLKDILNNEEEKDKEKEDNKKSKKVKQNNANEDILYNYDRYINKIINKDLTQRLKKIKIKTEKNKIEKALNDYPSKININIGKYSSARNIKCEDRCFQTFMIHLNDDMIKKYYIKRNRERLLREKSFLYKKELKLKEEENEKDIIIECLEKYKKGLKK